jgi:hypothetical protein
MSRLLYVKKQNKWISKREEDFQIKILESIWNTGEETKVCGSRIIYNKLTLNTFETYYTTQNEFVDYEALEFLSGQTGVTTKQIKRWFVNRRVRGVRLPCTLIA